MKLFATSAFAAALLSLPFASASLLLLDDDGQQLLAQQDASLWLGADGPEEYSLPQSDEKVDDAVQLSETSADATPTKEDYRDARDAWANVYSANGGYKPEGLWSYYSRLHAGTAK